MVSAYERTLLLQGLKSYAREYNENPSSRLDKQLARSRELRNLLLGLSAREPLLVSRLLKLVIRKNEADLRYEEEAQANRKRTSPWDYTTRYVKRGKYNCPDEFQATQQDAMDDDEETGMKNETNGPEGATMVSPSQYEKEHGLMMRVPAMQEYVIAELLARRPQDTQPDSKYREEVAKIWKIVTLLDFYKTKRDLAQHLESREKATDNELHARTDWDITDISKILDALQGIKRSTLDNKIHRAYGQTRLVLSVDAQVARGYRPVGTSHRSDHLAILEELAYQKAGPVSKAELDQMAGSYVYEYHAGQKWLTIMDWFGGSGTVLVFVIAGVRAEFMRKWNEYQSGCVQHIAEILQSIQRLIKSLGPDALDHYCRQGRLGNDSLDRVKQAEFTRPDKADESHEDEEDDNEKAENQGNEQEQDESEVEQDENDEE